MERDTKICRTCATELSTCNFRKGRRSCVRCEEKRYVKNWEDKTCIVCNKCNKKKLISEYYKNHKRCKSCYSKDYKNKQPCFEDKKDYMLRYCYGQDFGLEEYNNLVKKQNNLCAICFNPNVNGKKTTTNLYVDHDHLNGNVRGLLCSNCNRMLGLIKEDLNVLNNAIDYLKLYTSSLSPPCLPS